MSDTTPVSTSPAVAPDADPPKTLVDIVRPSMVSFDKLVHDYPFIGLLRTMLGVSPNALATTAIFRPAFQVENVIVPPFLDLPSSILGLSTDLRLTGFAMYHASMATECMYCTLHCATMSLRRGLPETQFSETRDKQTPQMRAAMDLGRALGTVPCTMSREVSESLKEAFSNNPRQAEAILLGVCMMGWLGRFMDMSGMDMESALVDEVESILRPLGWSEGRHSVADPVHSLQEPETAPRRNDTIGAKLEVLSYLPSALMFDVRATRGVPGNWPSTGEFLNQHLGYNFPVLQRFTSDRVRKAVATTLRDNICAPECTINRRTKYLLGVAYAVVAESEPLAKDMAVLVGGIEPDDGSLRAIRAIAHECKVGVDCDQAWVDGTYEKLRRAIAEDDTHTAAFTIGLAACTSPARMTPPVLRLAERALTHAQIVELTSWLGLVTMLNRMVAYFEHVPME